MLEAEKKERGQALIELIVFLPLIFMLYSVVSGYANAINGSINQQKVARSYFFKRVQNNPYLPSSFENGWQQAGMFFIGWADKLESDSVPVQPCYKVTVPVSPSLGDQCDQPYTTETTQFIRVGTVFGVCGGTFALIGGGSSSAISPAHLPDAMGASFLSASDYGSCLIQ